MVRGEEPFDAAKVATAFAHWTETAQKLSSLFPEPPKPAEDTRALPRSGKTRATLRLRSPLSVRRWPTIRTRRRRSTSLRLPCQLSARPVATATNPIGDRRQRRGSRGKRNKTRPMQSACHIDEFTFVIGADGWVEAVAHCIEEATRLSMRAWTVAAFSVAPSPASAGSPSHRILTSMRSAVA